MNFRRNGHRKNRRLRSADPYTNVHVALRGTSSTCGATKENGAGSDAGTRKKLLRTNFEITPVQLFTDNRLKRNIVVRYSLSA